MFYFIAGPMGSVLRFIYDNLAFANYGSEIILFTLLVKSAMLLLSIKQYRSTERMSTLQPQMKEIQKKYKDNPDRFVIVKLAKEKSVSAVSALQGEE